MPLSHFDGVLRGDGALAVAGRGVFVLVATPRAASPRRLSPSRHSGQRRMPRIVAKTMWSRAARLPIQVSEILSLNFYLGAPCAIAKSFCRTFADRCFAGNSHSRNRIVRRGNRHFGRSGQGANGRPRACAWQEDGRWAFRRPPENADREAVGRRQDVSTCRRE